MPMTRINAAVCCLFLMFAIAFLGCMTKETVIETETPPVKLISPTAPPEKPLTPLIDMVLIKGGSFSMGSPKGTPFSLDIERPVQRVAIRDFFLGRYEVTQGEYFEVTGTRPSHFMTSGDDTGPDGWRNLPVEMVTWYETIAFCNMLSIKEKLRPAYFVNGSANPDLWGKVPSEKNLVWDAAGIIEGANGYRLPTEAEWEYAARGGVNQDKYVYAGSNNASLVSWYYDNSGYRIREIGKRAPNSLGLHDLSGNVMEWCWDWLGDYSTESLDNPIGPPSGLYRVIRGGGWSVSVHYSRVAFRHNNNPNYRGVNLGFRIARWE